MRVSCTPVPPSIDALSPHFDSVQEHILPSSVYISRNSGQNVCTKHHSSAMDLSGPKGPIGSMKLRAPKLFVSLLILSCSLALAQTAPAPAPPSGKVVTMPVSEIKVGMKGVAWTVFE